MAKYRNDLPQQSGQLFLTDGGIETTLIFHEGLELPDFAAFHLLASDDGAEALHKYFASYAEIAKDFDTGLVLESATWRANSDWATRLGYSPEALANANHKAIELLESIRVEFESNDKPIVLSGCIGPRGDGYIADSAMSAAAACDYHREQVQTFAETSADMVCAITMNYVEEAIGVTKAAEEIGMPVAISFTVETDGNLPTAQSLRAAIEQVDNETSGYSSYFMINCAHPTHFESTLGEDGEWLNRIRGLRANASRKSHAELDESTELDVGNPDELGAQYANLKSKLRHLNVMGGCCGTDHRHISKIAASCVPLFNEVA